MQYVKARRVPLKAHPELNERWLQRSIAEDVELLGLGELEVKDAERRQPRAGRLDLLLFDPESNTRYEVEVQLGATDESHIIRTLEYWDNERRRFPQYEHVAVIVAEEITGRFLNVINLFNQAIPLVAVQLSALDVAGALTLSATKVLDIALPAPEEDDEPGQETDRSYWLSKSSQPVLGIADQVLEIINVTGEAMSLNYNKYYIGLHRNGIADNFVTFRPRKKNLVWDLRIDQSEDLDTRIEDAGLALLPYDKRWKKYRVRLEAKDVARNRALVTELVRLARGLPAAAAPDDTLTV
jgi:hypothetical protein